MVLCTGHYSFLSTFLGALGLCEEHIIVVENIYTQKRESLRFMTAHVSFEPSVLMKTPTFL